MATIILRGGRVVDPANNVDRVADVEIADGRVTRVGVVPASENATELDVTGCLVTPGLIDYHTHLYSGGSVFGFNADLLFAAGVTATVDAGTAGTIGFEEFRRAQSHRSMPWRAYINLSSMGQVGGGINECLDPSLVDEAGIAAMLKKYPDLLLGIKVRISRPIVGGWGDAPLTKALDLAGRLGVPICVHSTDPCIPMAELAERLRPGDVFCHIFHGRGDTLLDADGKVHPAIRRAAERGVIMDAANGRSNFNFRSARAAIDQGFLPHIISSDLTAATAFNGEMANNLPFLLSKYLCMGMDLSSVIRAATAAPAACMGSLDEIGTLTPGSRADVAILSLIDRPIRFRDAEGETMDGDRVLVPKMTLLAGQPMYDDNSLPRRTV